MKTCKSCHTENRDNAKYCKECGAILLDENPFANLFAKNDQLALLNRFRQSCSLRHHVMEYAGRDKAREIGLDCLISGDAGTGKTYLAELLHAIALQEKVISQKEIAVYDASEIEVFNKNLDSILLTNVYGIILITNAQKLVSETFREVSQLDKLFRKMAVSHNMPIIFLSGLRMGMAPFIKNNPDVVSRFEFQFSLSPFSDKDLTDLTCLTLNSWKLALSDDARNKMQAHFKYLCRHRDESFENASLASKKAQEFYANMNSRGGVQIEEQDIQGKVFIQKTEKEILEELDAFVGMQNVKDEIRSIIDTLKAERRTKGPNAVIRLKDHYVFTGNPGTGKTTIARIFAELLDSMEVLPSGQMVEAHRKDLVGAYMGSTAQKVEAMVSKALGGVLFIDEAYALKSGDADEYGQEAIDTLLPILENRRGEFICIIAGYTKEMGEFLRTNSGLESRFNKTIDFPDYNAKELLAIFQGFVRSGGLRLSDEAINKLPRFFDKMYLGRRDNFGNARDVRSVFQAAVTRLNKRRSSMNDAEFNSIGDVLEWADIVGESEAKELSVDDVMRELDSFVGMKNVKQAIRDLADEMILDQKRLDAGVGKASLTSVNIILTGKPGTGKTSIARIFGKLFKAIGVTSTDRVIEKSRKDLTSSYVNQSDKLMDKAINEAMGGVLFIDEAYALAPYDDTGHCNDSEGLKALERLLTRMENDRGKFVVICAGYKDKMQNLFKANDGFRSRFTHEIDIDDYDANELTDIFEGFVRKGGFILSGDDARDKARRMFEAMTLAKTDTFGNAREARKKYDESKRNQARRLKSMNYADLSKQDLITICPEDIPFSDKEISVDEVMKELDGFIGMASVKNAVRELAGKLAFEKKRIEAGVGKATLEPVNIILTGNPGTGKTSVARVLGKLFKAIGLTRTDKVVEKSRKDIVGQFVNQSDKMMDEAVNSAMGGVLFIDEAYAIAPVNEMGRCNDPEGIKALERLMTRMENDRGKFVVICAGYKDRMDQFLRANPGLPRRFNYRIHIDDYSAEELTQIYVRFLEKDNYSIKDDGVRALALKMFEAMLLTKDDSFGNAGEARIMYEQTTRNLANRLRKMNGTHDSDQMTTITREDIPYKEPEKVSPDACLAELDELIGLSDIKVSLRKLVDTVNIQQQLARKTGGKTSIPVGHYMFLGNPGTGKTTVARLMGKILYSMGAIARPDVLEVDKSGLVAGFVGQSEAKTSEVIRRAMGGVLFIDEAYELASDQFGRNSLDILLKQLEDKRGQFVCIVAGYSREMQEFIASNSGLASRFPTRNCFVFEDYDPEDLYAIFEHFCRKEQIIITPAAKIKVQEAIRRMYEKRDYRFGNAREVRNLFDSIKMNLSSRVLCLPDASIDDMRTIQEEDVI